MEMKLRRIIDEIEKIIYTKKYLKGSVWKWFEPVIRDYIEIVEEDWSDKIKKIM